MMAPQDTASARAGSQIGRSVARLEARDKVTGRAEYVHLMRLPGMLWEGFSAAPSRTVASSASTRAPRANIQTCTAW